MKYKIILSNNLQNRIWYLFDKNYYKFHRLDGPAIENYNGYKAWYKNGVRHRIDGPAVIWSDGSKEYYIDGVRRNPIEYKICYNVL